MSYFSLRYLSIFILIIGISSQTSFLPGNQSRAQDGNNEPILIIPQDDLSTGGFENSNDVINKSEEFLNNIDQNKEQKLISPGNLDDVIIPDLNDNFISPSQNNQNSQFEGNVIDDKAPINILPDAEFEEGQIIGKKESYDGSGGSSIIIKNNQDESSTIFPGGNLENEQPNINEPTNLLPQNEKIVTEELIESIEVTKYEDATVKTIWDNSASEKLVSLIGKTPNFKDEILQQSFLKLMQMPDNFVTSGNYTFLLKRVEKLIRAGFSMQALELLQKEAGPDQSDEFGFMEIQAYLAHFNYQEACKRVGFFQSSLDIKYRLLYSDYKSLCLYLNGDFEGAYLSYSLKKEANKVFSNSASKVEMPVFSKNHLYNEIILAQILDGLDPKIEVKLANLEPFLYAILRKRQFKDINITKNSLPLYSLQDVYSDNGLGLANKIIWAEKAARLGLIDALELAKLYEIVNYDHSEIKRITSTLNNLPGSKTNAGLYQAFIKAQNTENKYKLLHAYLIEAHKRGIYKSSVFATKAEILSLQFDIKYNSYASFVIYSLLELGKLDAAIDWIVKLDEAEDESNLIKQDNNSNTEKNVQLGNANNKYTQIMQLTNFIKLAGEQIDDLRLRNDNVSSVESDFVKALNLTNDNLMQKIDRLLAPGNINLVEAKKTVLTKISKNLLNKQFGEAAFNSLILISNKGKLSQSFELVELGVAILKNANFNDLAKDISRTFIINMRFGN